jgi:hypothetical protein
MAPIVPCWHHEEVSEISAASEFGWMSEAVIAEFERALWIGVLARRLRLVATGETWIRTGHRYGFRCGQWARLLHQTESRGRPCYVVAFEDGLMDNWVIDDPDGQYEFFPPTGRSG